MRVPFIHRWLVAAVAILMILTAPLSVVQAAESDEKVDSVVMNPSTNQTMYVGENLDLSLKADMLGTGANPKDVTDIAIWSSSNSTVLTVDKGKVKGLKKGTATVTGLYRGKSSSVEVTVHKYESLNIEGPTGPFKLGDKGVKLTADAKYDSADKSREVTDGDSNDITKFVTWKSSDENVVTVKQGELTFNSAGKAKISVTYLDMKDSVDIEVVSPYEKIEISASQAGESPFKEIELRMGDKSKKLYAHATSIDSGVGKVEVTQDATWTSSNPSVVTVDKGEVKLVSNGSTKLTVTHLGKSVDVNVIVRLEYQALVLTPDDKSHDFFLGDKDLYVTATMMNSNIDKRDVTNAATWKSSDNYVATVKNGVISPMGRGNATITIEHLGLKKEIQVNVYKPLSELTVENKEKIKEEDRKDKSKTSVTLFKNEVQTLPKVTGKQIDGETIDLTSKMTWTSTAEATDVKGDDIAKVVDGKIVASKKGKTTLKGTINNHTVTIEVEVQEKVLALIAEETNMSLVAGRDYGSDKSNLPVVKAIFEDGTEVENVSDKIEWKASSPNLLVTEKNMKGLLASRVSLKGTYMNKTVTIAVTIEDEISKIVVEPEVIDLNPNRSKSIKVVGTYVTGKNVTLSSKVNWISSDPTVATVRGSSVKALKEGTVTLHAKYQDKTFEVKVRVLPKLNKLLPNENRLKLTVGQGQKINLTALFDNGGVVNVTSEAKWYSNNPLIATVDSNGNIKAVKKGSTSIKATYNGKSVSISVSVR
ncbi:Ig-like domain-containing protein [Paenibacillus sp. N1-5-1-14]|uniref:Ig-like domain-containing protein n=1 Tax=Paenibacillus radicibacter TaxID=2972488 RepID=UPI0021599F26|nr:Ig-like domain-containing protein [Paenibacillus radicibacter]MCR8645625.1 Ig-like domain-containing protein [Paenibacillus radicibacter]